MDRGGELGLEFSVMCEAQRNMESLSVSLNPFCAVERDIDQNLCDNPTVHVSGPSSISVDSFPKFSYKVNVAKLVRNGSH